MGEEERGGLAAFLHKLAVNADAFQAYIEDPVETLKNEEGLTWKQRFLLLANDLEAIRDELKTEIDDDAALYVTVWHPTPPTVWH